MRIIKNLRVEEWQEAAEAGDHESAWGWKAFCEAVEKAKAELDEISSGELRSQGGRMNFNEPATNR